MVYVDFKSINEKLTKEKRDLPPMGMRIYTAPQGHGKTLSMVHDAIKLKEKYPKLYVVSNIETPISNYIFTGTNELKKALRFDNKENGILLIIDEFQLFASKKQGIGYEVFQGLCQQRKCRRFMMGTAQDWEDVDVSARKKVKEVVKCTKVMNLQINRIFDGYSIKWDKKENEWQCKQIGISIFKHNDNLYKSYDTFAEITTNDELIERINVSQSLPQERSA